MQNHTPQGSDTPATTKPHYTMAQIKAHNKSAGLFFFSASTIKFFRSKVESRVYQGPGGIYFVTSEKQGFSDDSPRACSIRRYNPTTGAIDAGTQGQRFTDAKHARQRAQELASDATNARESDDPTKAQQEPREKIKTLTIEGRRWFQRSYGNTYHTARILINGAHVHTTAQAYGYGQQYEETALKWLESQNLIPQRDPSQRTREFFESQGIEYRCSAQDVNRERDL